MSFLQIQDKWTKIKFGDIVFTVNENEFNPLQNGITKYVAGEHIESENLYVTKFGDIKKNKEVIGSAFHRKFSKGDILFGTRRAYLKKAGIATFDGICANTTLVLQPKNNNFSKELLPFIVQWEKFTEFAVSRSVGSTNPYVRWRDLADFEFYLPSLNDQIRISELFWSIQKSIDSLDTLIQKLEIYKNSKANELFTKGIGHTKYKKIKWLFGKEIEVPETWTKTTFSEISQLKTGSTPSRARPDYFNGNIPWVTSTDLNRGLITKTLENISKEAKEKTRLKIIPKGTFVIATYGLEAAGTRGKCGILNMDATINQACMAFLPSEKIDTMFLFYFYLEYGERIAFNFAQGTKQQNLYPYTFKQIPFVLPSILEQQKIASILSNIHEQIDHLENHLSKLKTIRKSIINEKLTPPKMEDKIV